MKRILTLMCVIFLVSCTEEIPTTQYQKWGEYEFRLESRPPVVEKGMNEFLFLGNFKERGRAIDLIVYFRMGYTGKWVQAIQDGHTGVYRRAMKVEDPEKEILFVHVKLKEDTQKEEVFQFPMNYSSSSSKTGT